MASNHGMRKQLRKDERTSVKQSEATAWRLEADRIHRKVLTKRKRPWKPYGDQDALFLAVGMGGEAGEVLNEVKKWLRGDYTREQFIALLRGEVADVLVLLHLFATCFGLDLDHECKMKLAKVAKRWRGSGKKAKKS